MSATGDRVEPANKRDRVRYAPKADKSPHRSEMTRRANNPSRPASFNHLIRAQQERFRQR
jgi:hypothetical protein